MKFDPARFGEGSRANPDYNWTWELAERRDQESPGPPGSRWVPRDVVFLKDGVSPRLVDEEAVERYRWVLMDIPPIRVQRGTFVLIDGRHRLEAHYRGSSEVIRICEVDVADEDLAVAAFTANLEHGKPYTQAERIAGLKMLVTVEPYRSWSSNQLASYVGLARNTVDKYRPQDGGARVGQDGKVYPPAPVRHEVAQIAQPEPRPKTPVPTPRAAPERPAVATFDPGRDVDPDDWDAPPARTDVDSETGERFTPSEDERIEDRDNFIDGPYRFRVELTAPCDKEGAAIQPDRLRAIAERAKNWIDRCVEVYC